MIEHAVSVKNCSVQRKLKEAQISVPSMRESIQQSGRAVQRHNVVEAEYRVVCKNKVDYILLFKALFIGEMAERSKAPD
jgi:hypothetical protein